MKGLVISQKNVSRPKVVVGIGLSLWLLIDHTQATPQRLETPSHGVVVEQVGENSALARAGIVAGDVLVSWQRMPNPPSNPQQAQEQLISPFDWRWLTIEQVPRGTVRLTVLRGGEVHISEVDSGEWDSFVRPRMSMAMLEVYQRAEEQVQSGDIESAALLWNKLMGRSEVIEDWRFRCWMLLRAAEVWGEVKEWERAHVAFGLAHEAAQDQLAQVTVQHAVGRAHQEQGELQVAREAYNEAHTIAERTWGESLILAKGLNEQGTVASLQGKLDVAQGYAARAMEITQRLAPASLAMAMSLNNLGDVARLRGELRTAAEFHQGALRIRQTLAPDSLAVAASLNNLGVVAYERGELERSTEYSNRALEIREKLAPDGLDVAKSLNNLGLVAYKRGELQKAADYHERSLEISQRLAPNSISVSGSLNNLGLVAVRRGELQEAEGYYQRSLEITQKLSPDSLYVGFNLKNLGDVALRRSEFDLATDHYQRALDIFQQVAPASLYVAATLNSLAVAARERGDLDLAVEHQKRALQIKQRLAPDSLAVANSLLEQGHVAYDRGDLERAAEYYQRSLAIAQKLAPDSLRVAAQLHNQALVASARGDLARAAEYYDRALQIKQKLAPQSLSVASTLNNLATVVLGRGELERAAEYYQRSLEISNQVAPDSNHVAVALDNLGLVAREHGELELADQYHQRSLKISQKVAPDSLHVAASLNNLGSVARTRGELERAAEYYQRALEVSQKVAPDSLYVATTLHNRGSVAYDSGELELAADDYRRSLAITQKLAPDSVSTVNRLIGMAAVHNKKNQSELAIDFLEKAVAVLENQIGQLGGSRDVQARFRADYGPYYHVAVKLLVEQNQPQKAFHVLERYRAQTFLTQLSERDLLFADLPEEFNRARQRLGVSYDRTQQQMIQLSPKDHPDELGTLRTRLRQLREEAEAIKERMRRESPRLADLQYPTALEVEAAQQSLDAGTVMLSYSVATEETLLFVLTRAGHLAVHDLPVGDQALRQKVHHFHHLIPETGSGGEFGAASRGSLQELSRELYRTLVEPAADLVENSERILLVPDGPLHLLPFGALLRETTEDEKDGERHYQYLVEWKPLHTVLSATVYAQIKKTRRPESQARATQLAAFGAPSYPAALHQSSRDSIVDIRVRSVAERGLLDWTPIPWSRQEIEGITSLYPEEQVQKHLADEATEERAKSIGEEPRILHFATHGFIDDHLPYNSGLALTVPEEFSEDRENGLLQVWEIFEQVRIDADLVVLSACQSALGEEQGGDGLIGLTRAFQYAGARTVAATLWNVNDQTTAELMVRFYRHLRAGKSKDEALRAAQVEFIRNPIEVKDESGDPMSMDASAPYYWAAFQLYGDWQ